MPPSRPAETTLDAAALSAWPLPDDHEDDKRGRGTVLIIGGSVETPGAVLLAGVAALRVGAGRLQIASAQRVAAHLAVAVPEALVTAYDDVRVPPLEERIATADAIVFGPGLSDPEIAANLLATVLGHAARETVVVVDAMGLDVLPDLAEHVRDGAPVIVTPNREELTGLMRGGTTDSCPECAVARRYGVTVVSFGRVAGPDGSCSVDRGAVTGLGTSGAGDILAGAVGGIAARTHDVRAATGWATLAHRIAANRAAATIAPVGYLAREVADELPGALTELQDLVRRSA